MPSSYLVYIDESGDEGFKFRPDPAGYGSSHWFVLSAAVFRRANESEQVRLVDEVRRRLGKPSTKDLHFTDLVHEQRVVYTSLISAARLKCISVLVHKPSLRELGAFQLKNRLYHFATRLLLERVSWLCAQYRRDDDGGDGTAELVFSHRRNTPHAGIAFYLTTLQSRETEIDWSSIVPAQVKSLPHAQRKGLWIADAVASAYWHGLEPNRHGFTEPRYAQMLRPVIWSRKKSFAGIGLKLWPAEATAALSQEHHAWLNDFGIHQ